MEDDGEGTWDGMETGRGGEGHRFPEVTLDRFSFQSLFQQTILRKGRAGLAVEV